MLAISAPAPALASTEVAPLWSCRKVLVIPVHGDPSRGACASLGTEERPFDNPSSCSCGSQGRCRRTAAWQLSGLRSV